LSHPRSPHHERLAKQAKALLKSLRAGDRATAARFRDHHPRAGDLDLDAILATPWKLADAQLTLAREHGQPSWPKLVARLDALPPGARDDQIHPHVRLLESFQRRVGRPTSPVPVADWIRHEAATLLTLHAADDPDASPPLRFHVHELRELPDADILARPLSEPEALDTMARAYWFRDWDHAQGRDATVDPAFESAADAVVHGDLATLDALLSEHPALATQTSPFGHGATLLHYTSANGVESWRQRTPRNLVDIARRLLAAGAAVDAVCDAYGGGQHQTTLYLALSSGHPADAGLQVPLVDVLLDAGSEVEGVQGDGTPLVTALAFGYRDTARHLVTRGARIRNLVQAAGLGDLEAVRAWVGDPEQVYVDVYGKRIEGLDRLRNEALLLAARHGEPAIARVLLEAGADANTTMPHKRAPLHGAAYGGNVELIDTLLEFGADAGKVETYYDATPADWAREGGHAELEARLREAAR